MAVGTKAKAVTSDSPLEAVATKYGIANTLGKFKIPQTVFNGGLSPV